MIKTMSENVNSDLTVLFNQFFRRNYDYLYLKTMLEKARTTAIPNSTLITGSSHALNGIWEGAWKNAVNCSMHSQDIFYDFQCAKRVLEASNGQVFTRCIIVMGYYIAFQDLSLSKISRETMISRVYYPIFRDAHNWSEPVAAVLWDGMGSISEPMKKFCEQTASALIMEVGSYYNRFRARGSYFDLKGRKWAEVSMPEREAMGQYRASEHNNVLKHTTSFTENKEILREFVRLLYLNGIQPIVVVTPFTQEYDRYVQQELRDGVLELLDSVPEDVHFVDFNQAPNLFDATDFMDTDHLSQRGAKKVSGILTEMFGT